MKLLDKYRYVVEDEAHLREVASGRFTRLGFIAVAAGCFLAAFILAGILIALTPIRTLLPGYMKASQRSATELGLMRLDSLMAAYEVNEAYIRNYLKVTDPALAGGDSVAVEPVSRDFSADSLANPSRLEQSFVNQMAERERFSISVLAPLAADGVLFSPVSADGVFTAASREAEEAEVIFPADENVMAPADGSVIALYPSAALHGYVILVQHPRGFVTSLAGTGTPLVGVGDRVSSGQIIALAPQPDSKGLRKLVLRMWHNGLNLVPYDYLGDPSLHRESARPASFEDPRGR